MMEQLDFHIPITWPRRVMAGKNHRVYMNNTWRYGQFLVESLDEFIQVVRAANNIDIFIHTHSEQNLKNGYIENLLLDFDSESDIDLAKKAAMKASAEIEKFFDVKPLIYFSGNKGFHVVLPFRQAPLPEGASELGSFLSFIAKTMIKKAQLNKNQSVDWQVVNSPLRFIRLIGSYHSGVQMHRVEPIQDWNGNFADSRLLYGNFRMARLIEQTKLRKTLKNSKSYNAPGYEWIEKILNKPLPDGRKRMLWLVIAPYLINVLGLNTRDAYSITRSFLIKCNELNPLKPGFCSFMNIARYQLEHAKDTGYKPWKLETIQNRDPQLYEMIKEALKE